MIQEADFWRTLDRFGVTMPWYTRACCAWLENMNFKGVHIWEWGGGQSTRWYRGRGADVSGVDSDIEWARLSGLVHTPEKQGYITSISGSYDIICIDGDYRDECFVYALHALTPGGTVIIDNWKQASAGWPEWPETERLIRQLNLKVTEYPQEGHQDWVTITVQR